MNMKPCEDGEGVAMNKTSKGLTYPNMTQDEPERVKEIQAFALIVDRQTKSANPIRFDGGLLAHDGRGQLHLYRDEGSAPSPFGFERIVPVYISTASISVSEKRADELETASRDWESAYMANLKFQAAIFEDMKRAISERDSSQASLLRVVEALKPFVVAFVRVAPKGVAHSDAGDNIMETLMVPRGACLTARTALSPHTEK